MYRKIMFLSKRAVNYFFVGDALAFFVYAAWKFGVDSVLSLSVLPLILLGLFELARYGLSWEKFGPKTVRFWRRTALNFLVAVASLTGLIVALMIDRTGAIILLSALALYTVLMVVEAVVWIWQSGMKLHQFLQSRREKSV